MNQGYLLNDAAKRAGVRGYQIAYAITQGHLPEVQNWLNHQRIFNDEDIARIRQHFATRPKRGCPGIPRREAE